MGPQGRPLDEAHRSAPSFHSASAYRDLASAQRDTRAALDDIDNAGPIEKWIERVDQRERNHPAWGPNNTKTFPPLVLAFPDATGCTVEAPTTMRAE